MDTARVDLRKLQMLNDRINQCLDALSQVRFSVHGLSHTSQQPGGIGGFGGQNQAFGGGAGPGIAGNPYGTPYGGLFHTPQPPGPQLGTFGLQGGGQGLGFAPGYPNPTWNLAWNPGSGLSHSGGEIDPYARPVWSDPTLAAKVRETFPFVQYALPPVVSLY